MFPLSDSIRSNRIPLFNYGIIGLTIYVFIQQITSVDPEGFILKYALTPAAINFSNYSTLLPFITSMFLHGGILHIVSNMWFLWVFGDDVEGHIGPFFFVLMYLASGILGSLVQYMLMPFSPIPMLGASGAVAGVLGAYYVLFPHSKIKTLVPVFGFVTVTQIPATFMLGYWFILQVLSGAASLPLAGETGGVAFFAHVGGFITGVIFGNIFKKEFHIREEEWQT